VRLGRWLNSLTLLDHLVILGLFALACFLAHATLVGIRTWYHHLHKDNPYATEFRVTPIFFLGTAIFYTVIIYRLIGTIVTTWIQTLIG
jgi:hypothetical protein